MGHSCGTLFRYHYGTTITITAMGHDYQFTF